ncbi:MAG: hypothetical protein J7539_05980 [Niabella sp.]|nr:hypothetical protein [Niabella sp.]
MKTKFFNTSLALLLAGMLISGCAASITAQAPVPVPTEDGPITYQTFYDDLSPYGTWIDYPGYGHVWHPGMGSGFRPYATGGHWVYSGEGWAWASDYSWGWAPFHYGRWIYDDAYGWLWVPGYTWSPAWVTWGYVDNYYCWAPLMPGVSVTAGFGSYMPHSIYWNMVERGHIYDRNVTTYVQHTEVVNNIQNRITIINNYNHTNINNHYYSTGPQVNEVQKYTNVHINTVNIREVNKNNITINNNRNTINNNTVVNNNTNNSRNTTINNNNSNNRNTTVINNNRNTRINTNTTVNTNNNEMRVYRPAVQQPQTTRQQPQPKEFRQVPANSIRPVRSASDHPMGQRQEQVDNINHLPRGNTQRATPPRDSGRRGR